MREHSAYPPELRNVDYGCFNGQRNPDHTTERLQGGFKVPMETGRNLEHTTERYQREFKVPMETGSLTVFVWQPQHGMASGAFAILLCLIGFQHQTALFYLTVLAIM